MRAEINKPRPNLYLIGFMGVGKSAVGRFIAKALNMRFIDSDHAIEEKSGLTIPAIFESMGEAAFRQMERDFITSGHPEHGCVVSCGGGLPVEPGMRELLLSKGVVVCLFASESTIVERTSRNDKRPMLQGDDPVGRIRELMDKRLPIYMNTGTGISTENRSLTEVVDHVVRVYDQAARGTRRKPRPR
ncbi:MAG: shikimate kinase [Opitutales bacterium]|jgi:shikimate kinase